MADDTKLFSIAEEGCLRVSSYIRQVVYHRSLNVLLVFSSNGPRDTEIKVFVLDIASGAVLHDTKLSPSLSNQTGPESEKENEGSSTDTFIGPLKCLSIPERGTLIVAHNGFLGVRKDFGRTILLESILRPPVLSEDDIVHVEIPHNEAMLLRECLQTMDFGQSDSELGNMQTQVIALLTKHMKQYLFSVSKGSRMSSNWSIVNLELPLKTLKAVCTHAVLELKKNNRSIPALPIASSIVVRLASLLHQPNQNQLPQSSSPPVKEELPPFYQPSTSTSNNNNSFGGNSWEASSCPALHPMTSEAARRETFASWPHMNYKWALPAQMAEAGFYHQPNTPESDRAVCFLCNVCLICWEPSDEPWSEHERHAATCPLVKGDYTSNVPVAVTVATQPAVQQSSQAAETIACVSTTSCPDLFATSTSGGLVVLWNISGILKREISFNAAHTSQLPGPIRVTSLSVVSGMPVIGQQPVRCTLVVGATLGDDPFLVVYDVAWTRTYTDVQSEPGPSTLTSNASGTTIKKGGTTKKVLPTPHTLNQNSSGIGTTAANTESSANPGLFFSFGDDPLDEDMYISSMDANEKLGKATGLLNKLMHNMGSPFTNTVMPQQLLGDKTSSSHSFSGTAPVNPSKVSDQPEVTLNQPTLIKLKDCVSEEGLEVVSLTPTLDAGHLVAVVSPGQAKDPADDVGSHILLFPLKSNEGGLVERPVCQIKVPATDGPRCIVMLPLGDRNDESEWCAEEEAIAHGPMRAAVVTTDGRLRLLLIDPSAPRLSWFDLESVSSHKFIDATYCTSVERLCATTDKGDLVFFKITNQMGAANSTSKNTPSGRSASKKGKEPSPTKLLIHQPLTSETLQSLHGLTLAEKLPQTCQMSITTASCWMELAVTQRQRRQPQPWLLQPGGCTAPNNVGSEDGLQVARAFKLQQDKFSWDEHFFEISLPAGMPVAHVHLRFVLAPSCSVPPEIQVSLLEQRSRSLQWGRTSLNLNTGEEVDNHINFNMGQSSPRFTASASGSEATTNPILTQEYLEAHDAALLCGPFKLNQFLDATGQVAIMTLTSHQLLQSTARNFLVHLKYIPSVSHSNSLSLLSVARPMTNPCGRRTIQTKGCDWIQEVSISVQRSKPTSVHHERIHRCALLASSNFTGQLLEYGFKTTSRKEHIMVLGILNWKTAVHYGAPPGVASLTTGDVDGHVIEIFNQLKSLLEHFVIRGNRTTAQQVVQLLFSSHELGIQCLTEEVVTVLTKQLMHCLLQQLGSLQNCSSASVVHWFLVLLSRVYLRSETEVAGPVWAVLTQIISELHRRREPLQQLLQSRYGFYGRPFETELMFSLSEDQQQSASPVKPIRSNIAASFAALNQLVNPAGPCDKDKSYSYLETLSLKRSCDLLDVEPLPFALISASDGVRLEKADAGSSQFTAVALNGLVEASKLVSQKESHATSHRWQHLLAINSPLVVVMERLHSGGRKFVVLDFGAPILLTDVYIPACADWTSITVDVWNRTENNKTDADLVRLAVSSDINRRPVVLHDLQPPIVCRFLRLTVTGRQGLSASSCKTSIGSYYGHSLILPNDFVPAMQSEDVPVLTVEEIKENIATLEVLADHSQCHYNLAGDRLRSLLRPLLTHWHKDASGSSTHHIDHYLQSQVNASQLTNGEEDAKIVEAYEECLKLQRQQNSLWSALRRLRRCQAEMNPKEQDVLESEESITISQASSHKLHFIAQSMINVLLASTALKKQIKIERRTAEQLFQHLYVTSGPAAQLSTAALLSQSDDTYRWMPNFLADMLRKTLSSDPSTSLIPKDRVFVTLLFMGFKAIQLSSGIHLLDPILAVLNEQLSVLENRNNSSPFALAHLDLPFVNWLLLFCCCCLDRTATTTTKETKARDQRWDFLQGESLLSRDGANAGEPKSGGGSAASRIYRRKLQKKLMQQPHYGVSWPSGGVLSGSNKAKFILAHSKQKGSGFTMDSGVQMRRAAMLDDDMDSASTDDKEGGNSSRSMASSVGQPICSSSGAARVAKNLISFLLVIGASGSHEETFLLTCKVLARLIGASQNGLRLGHIADEQQLTTLLRLAASASGQPSQLWLNHAIYCLLIDYLRTTSPNKSSLIGNDGAGGSAKSCSVTSIFTHGASGRYDDILRSVGSDPEAGSSGSNATGSSPSGSSSASNLSQLLMKPKMKMGQVSKKLPPMTVPPELLAYEQAKLAAESLKVDQHVDDLLELFENPNSESVPPVLKKAWPSISSVMKNLAECKSSLAAGGYASSNGMLSSEEPSSSGAWDLRDESRCDGPWKLKSDILSDAFFEAVLQGLTSSFHDNKRRPLPEEIPGDPITATPQSDQHLLSSAFNNIFSSANCLRVKTDVIASLKMWVLLNSDNYSSSLDSDVGEASGASRQDSSAILLNREAIRGVLESLSKIPVMDVGDWTAVLRSLTWLSSPRWILTEPDEGRRSVENEMSPNEELADQTCAGTIIRSPYLTNILFNFISGQGLVPYSLGDKQLVGPSIVSTLGDVLSCLKVWCNAALVGSVLGSRLRSSLFELFLELAAPPRGPIARGIGPLDAQICFVEALFKLGVQGLDETLSIRVIQAVVSLSQMFLSRCGGLSCVDSSSQLSEDDRICFSGVHGSSALSALASGTTGNGNSRTSAITPSALLTLSLQLAIRLITNAEYGPSLNVADKLLSTPSIMEELLDAANCCVASSFASSLGVTALGDGDVAFSHLHTVADYTLELLHQIFVKTSNVKLLFHRIIEYIRPGVATLSSQGCHDLSEPLLIFILYVLKTKENVQIFHEVDGFKEVCLALSRTPIQLFNSHNRLVSNVLSYVSQTTATNGQGSSRTRLSSRQARTGTGSIFPGTTSSAPAGGIAQNNYVDSSSLGPLAVFRRSCLRLEDDDDYGLLNLAPLSTISCSHPSAQPADVLLQPNPPHRRARSPSWSHHFYPAEQFIELTITLPCPVLVKEIQLHPHLTSLATCPSAVGVEMSPESSSQLYPVGAVLSATGLTTIAFKLESPQVAALVLLRLYKPRDSSNIGLAQIRVLGSLALPSSDQQLSCANSAAGQYQPGLTWLCILHHCLSVAEKDDNNELMASLRQTAGSLEQPDMVERCCGLLNAHFTSPRAGILADVVQMASDILLHLGRHSSVLAHQFIRLQLQESPRLLLGCTPPVANVLYELCSAENESIASSVTPAGGSGQALLFQWLHRAAEQGSSTQVVSTSMVHCAAAVLWHSPCVIEEIVNYEFAKTLFEWTKVIHNPELKVAVDFALCSVCRHYPDIFNSLLSSVTISETSTSSSSASSILQCKSLMETLGRAAQSEPALEKLVQSGLLDLVSQTISEYCMCILKRQDTAVADLTERVAVALEFVTLLCEEWGSGASRDVLAAYLQEKSLLQLLLQALCSSSSGDCQGRLQASRIEDAAVAFFRQFCWGHRDNSRRFAEILLCVLQPTGSSCKLLTGFTRRLLLQLLLEPEKIYVYVSSASGQCGLPVSAAVLSSMTIAEPRHPAFNHGKKHKLLYISAETSCAELTRLLTDSISLPLPVLNCNDVKTALNLNNKRATTDRMVSTEDSEKKPKLSAFDSEDQQRRVISRMLQNQHYLTFADQPGSTLCGNWTLSQALGHQRQQNLFSRGALCIRLNSELDSVQSTPTQSSHPMSDQTVQPLTTLLEEFAALGGLAVLSKHLPMLLCASTSSTSSVAFESVTLSVKGANASGAQVSSQPLANAGSSSLSNHVNGVTSETIDSWVKLDGGSDDMDEEMDEILMPSGYFPPPTPQYINAKRSKSSGQSLPTTCALPLHSLAAFSLFLSMPLYTEAVLQDRRRAQMLLRLALGVSDDGQGGNILNSSDAALFPVLPFVLLQQVLDNHPLDSAKGAAIRQQAVDMGVLQLLLACLAVFTQQVTSANVAIPSLNVQFVVGTPNGSSSTTTTKTDSVTNPDSAPSAAAQTIALLGGAVSQLQQQQQQQYWAKGTGFGTGSTAQTWDLDGAMQRQRQQEEQATCLLHTLAAYVHPNCPPVAFIQADLTVTPTLPSELLNIVLSSHLVAAICSYLRNDSVMDMARHVPLYKAVLLLLRSIAACPKLVPLLLPSSTGNGKNGSGISSSTSQSIHSLLRKLKNCVSSYTARLASVQNRTTSTQEDSDSEEGIADLSKDICETWSIVKEVVLDYTGGDEVDGLDGKGGEPGKSSNRRSSLSSDKIRSRSPEKLYCDVMQPLQFDSYELLVESPDTVAGSRFTVAYHFENSVKAAGERCHPNRMKRLAQEVATLTTSLPLSLSSSVFVRCDTDRLDIMKVLITGPSDTPYGNGCFEFDVYFPPDYPQSPMQVHLATTGRHTVRFNPNLYNDGKVCLSVLNTWHGRPEEKWNPHTSSLLQVLVSIQSLILVSEPYFNEPGYERSRGTPSGNQNSRDYDVNIRQATVKWAMLEQIRNPSVCFKQVTHTHFWLKRQEIEKQCEEWIAEMEKQVESDPNGSRAVAVGLTALKRHYAQLKEELARLSPPACLSSVSQLDVKSVEQEENDGEEMEEDEVEEEEKPMKTSPLPSEEFAITYEEGEDGEEEDEDEDDEEDEEDDEEVSSQLLNVGKEEEAEGEGENDLEELKEIMFSNVDSDMPLSWKEDLEDSETEIDNFVSQFTI